MATGGFSRYFRTELSTLNCGISSLEKMSCLLWQAFLPRKDQAIECNELLLSSLQRHSAGSSQKELLGQKKMAESADLSQIALPQSPAHLS